MNREDINKKCAGCLWEDNCHSAGIDYYGGCEIYSGKMITYGGPLRSHAWTSVGECTGCIFEKDCKELWDYGDPCEWYTDCEDGAGDAEYYADILRENAGEYYEMIKEYSD